MTIPSVPSPGEGTRSHSPIRNRQGIILFLALFVLMVLGILALQFHFSARHARSTAFRLEQDESIRSLAEAAMDEAFAVVWRQAEVPGSELRRLLLEQPVDAACPVPLSLTVRHGAAPRLYLSPEVKAEARIFSSRRSDLWGQPYFRNERVGTLEIRVQAVFQSGHQGSSPSLSCRLTRHHDFKVASMVSAGPRSDFLYAHNHLLDYALLIRSGLEEFRNGNGFSANHPETRLRITQPSAERGGKIFFGGTTTDGPTAGSGQYPEEKCVFLNTSFPSGGSSIPQTAALIPSPGKHPDKIIVGQDVHDLFPKIMQVANEQKQKALSKVPPGPLGASARSQINAKFEQVKAELMKLRGIFHRIDLPVYGDPDPTLTNMRGAVQNYLLESQIGAGRNLDPGIDLLDSAGGIVDPARAEAVLEGDIRQRFLHMVYFELDASQVDPSILPPSFQADLQNIDKQWPCAQLSGTTLASLGEKQHFYQVLEELETRLGGPGESLFSNYEEAFPLKGGLDYAQIKTPSTLAAARFPAPRFFNRKGVPVRDPMPPYSHRNLYSINFPKAADLVTYGILDTVSDSRYELLNLRGIMEVGEGIQLGRSGKPVKAVGRGVLISTQNIDLFSGLECGKDDMCILFSRGEGINIHTDQEIQAGLMALNSQNTGAVQVNQSLKLKGMIAADLMNLSRWHSRTEPNVLAYDSRFNGGTDLYVVSLSRQITFQRMETQGTEDRIEDK